MDGGSVDSKDVWWMVEGGRECEEGIVTHEHTVS
jgi:hypothetical protein